ncbi:hypothetical protein J2X69_003633 [Algoriphagus sp. 4150]|uniref:hypothetical protein n=1 Tax=Algoriphagus sp. 4150 TaxID=2817756 RepID=UPI0028674A3F|nr:hypothetical protein [Algoriphagus sp. 4150]MDR7131272.1 hypothetical protein [Algoriphagus sp. 4150]
MNKELLIEDLILQDLRHMQLIYGLESIGLTEEGFHSLDLCFSIAELMGMRGEESIDRFYQVYKEHIEKCRELEMTYSRENLLPLAKECYQELKKLKSI